MDIIGQAEIREAYVARGEAECYMMLRELPRGTATRNRALTSTYSYVYSYFLSDRVKINY